MITENLSTLKIHKLTQAQYDRELEAGNIDPTALYLTPDEDRTLDTTLTISGQAADAKAVGDALANKQSIGDYALKSDIPESDYFIVTVTPTSDTAGTASHSSSEIKAAIDAGKIPVAVNTSNGTTMNCLFAGSTIATFYYTVVSAMDNDDNAYKSVMAMININNNKEAIVDEQYAIGVPSGGETGQVLTMGSDGNLMWDDAANNTGTTTGTIRETLFSNTNTSSSFAGQTITCDNLSNYDEIYIECASDSTTMNLGIIRNSLTIDYENNTIHALNLTFIYNGSANQLMRTLEISGNNIIISDCTLLSENGASTNNNYMIPTKIIGIKYNVVSGGSVEQLPAAEEELFG